MNMLVHIWIARQVYRQTSQRKKMYINLPAFICGSIWPDLDLRLARLPHDFDPAAEMVCEMAGKAAQINTAGQFFKHLQKSFELGIVCHYLSDFSCFAHSVQFTGNLSQHFVYELKMLLHLNDSCKIKIYRHALSWGIRENFQVFLLKAHALYKADSVGYTTDLAHAVNTSALAIGRLTRRSLAFIMPSVVVTSQKTSIGPPVLTSD